MRQWPIRTFLKQLEDFWALPDFIDALKKNSPSLSFDLTELLKKDTFYWNPSTQNAFDALNGALTKVFILALSDFTKTFVSQIDASGTGMAIVLT